MRSEEEQVMQRAFEAESIAKAQRDVRLAAFLAAVLFALFLLLDYIAYPRLFHTFLTIRSVAVITSVVVIFAVNTDPGGRYARELGTFAYLVWAGSIVVMVHLSGGYASPYYAGINLVLIAFLFLLPLDFKRALFVCATVYLAYLLPSVLGTGVQNFAAFANNHFFVITTMTLVVISAFLSTRMRYKEFKARYRLARANEELTELDALKSQFFANISHEVRTPLTSILGPVYDLYQGNLGRLSADQHAMVTQIYRNALRLLDMINQMLDFAKFEAGRMELRLSRVSLLEAVKAVTAAFGDVAAQKGIVLEHEVACEVPAVYLDREKLERILSNLVRNAIKFTHSGSVRVVLSCEDEYVVLHVVDTGIGIEQDHLETVFERFRQVDGSLSRRYEGTGLGLSIVKESVDIQHGSVTVASTPGEGSCFTVRLPTDLDERESSAPIERRATDRRTSDRPFDGPDRRRGPRRSADSSEIRLQNLAFVDKTSALEQPEGGTSEPGGAAFDGLQVLYVEDNADLREYVTTMLSRLGHRVQVAADGLEGLELLRTHPPDVVVSDIMMPRMDGYELLNAIKADEQTNTIPVVLTTAKSELDARIEGFETGADDYLAKPIIIRELDARIRNLVSGRRLQEASIRSEELEARINELSLSFSQSLELKDRYTAGHAVDVLTYGTIIAEEMNLVVDACVRDALLLHDIGKIGIPDQVLFKPGALEPDEWETMKSHSELGAELLRRFEHFKPVAEIILAHQERYDGTGYPRGLKGDEIPLTARVISVADAWHAMTEDRVYRKALNQREAALELLQNKGTQFDPDIVEAFLRGLLNHGMLEEAELRKAREMVNFRKL